MGQIDSSPRVQWTKVFSTNIGGSAMTLLVSMNHSLREDGALDPNRPGGPDNRRIVTDVDFTLYVLDSKSQHLFGDKIPEKLRSLVHELEANVGLKKNAQLIKFEEDHFADELVSYAKEKYELELKSQGKKSLSDIY